MAVKRCSDVRRQPDQTLNARHKALLPSPPSPLTAMTHIATQEVLDGKPVYWMEKVSDEQYQTLM
jgi:hypothetical protein